MNSRLFYYGFALWLLIGLLMYKEAHADDVIIREAIFDGLLLVDRNQTRDIANHPGMYETNILLGKHPSNQAIDNYFIAAAIGHGVITYLLPDKYKAAWQYSTIGLEVVVIGNNFGLGLHASF